MAKTRNAITVEEAERYLAQNRELARALGVDGVLDVELHPLGQGEHNVNFWFGAPDMGAGAGERNVLRINVAPQPFHKDQVGYEFNALSLLAPSGRVPLPLYVQRAQECPLGHGVIVERFCEGRELDFDALTSRDLDCVAQILADVHAVCVDADCGLHAQTDPARDLFDECLARFDAYKRSGFEDARLTRWAERFIARAQELLDVPFAQADRMHAINTEPLASHFLLPDSQGGVAEMPCALLGYFVDWERPILGEVAQDVAYFVSPTSTFWDSERLFTDDDSADFIERYWEAVDGRFARGSFDARFETYLALTKLRSITWCCKALPAYAKREGHTTGKTAAKLPIYLSDEFLSQL